MPSSRYPADHRESPSPELAGVPLPAEDSFHHANLSGVTIDLGAAGISGDDLRGANFTDAKSHFYAWRWAIFGHTTWPDGHVTDSGC
jgi:hypothetical protein